jgi:hypothetical protein
MGKIVSNRELIATPAVGQRRYGLFDAVASSNTMPTRMIASGLQFLTDHCDPAVAYDQTCEVSPVKPFTEGSDLMGADPFWVIARKRCGTVGRTAEEMRTAVARQLEAQAQTVVEEVLWDGGGLATIPAAQTLTGSGATIVTPTAPGAGAAVAALEAAFYAMVGYRGVIHVNTAAYAAVEYAQLSDPAGGAGTLRTPLGSTWSFGAGYDVTGPAGVAPAAGFVWAFMTPPVHMWSADIPQPDARQTLDRTLNQWDVVAERVYALTWDCPMVFAVQIPVAAPAVATAPAVP